MTAEAAPELTIVLVAGEDPAHLRRTAAAWRAQSVRDRIEVITVARGAARGVEEDALDGFHSHRTVHLDEVPSGAAAFTVGVRQARAPIVMLAEDHSFPRPGAAAAILAAYGPGVAAVGAVLENGNPDTAVSWAHMLVSFSRFMFRTVTVELDALPGHNTSYRVDALAALGDSLVGLYESERLLQYELEAKGARMVLAADARFDHCNASRWPSYLRMCYLGGRVLGAGRALRWPLSRRVAQAGGAPVVPLVRLWRMRSDFGRAPDPRVIVRAGPWLLAGLVHHAVGEAVGYLFGAGGSPAEYGRFELDRRAHVLPGERLWMDAV